MPRRSPALGRNASVVSELLQLGGFDLLGVDSEVGVVLGTHRLDQIELPGR
jgi:hypothetical protein